MENLNLNGAKILVCKKNCQSLDRFGNDLCERRRLEDREKISILYVGHTPPPARPAEFLTGLSEEALELLRKRDFWGPEHRSYIKLANCEEDGRVRWGNEWGNSLPLTSDEVKDIPRQEVGDDSFFLCPERRHWAKESKVQKCVIVEHEGRTVLVDQFGDALNLEGEEISLAIDVPLPGNPGSEKVTYYPSSVGDFQGRQYYYRDREKAPQCFLDVQKHLFRPSPTAQLEIGESEILIIQKPVSSSDWGHQSDISVLRAGDKVAKYTPGQNRHLLKPGEKVSLPESFRGGNGWHTKKYTFENQGGRLVKYLTEGRDFALKQAEALMSSGLAKDDAWKIIKAAGPGAAQKAFEYGADLVRQFPEKVDLLLTTLRQIGPPKSPGRSRTEKVITSLGFPIPEAKNSGEFFRILAGARQLVQLVSQGKYNLA